MRRWWIHYVIGVEEGEKMRVNKSVKMVCDWKERENKNDLYDEREIGDGDMRIGWCNEWWIWDWGGRYLVEENGDWKKLDERWFERVVKEWSYDMKRKW